MCVCSEGKEEIGELDRVKGWHELGDNEKVVRIMDRACCDEAVTRAVESLWKKRFVADAPIPLQT